MPGDLALRKQKWLFGILAVAVVAFAAGIWAALTPQSAIGSFVKPVVALLLVLTGLLYLFPLAAFGPRNEYERKTRIRTSIMGAAQIVYGMAQVMPSLKISVTLTYLSLLCMLAALPGISNRLFARRA